jgi:hypothetical protein
MTMVTLPDSFTKVYWRSPNAGLTRMELQFRKDWLRVDP